MAKTRQLPASHPRSGNIRRVRKASRPRALRLEQLEVRALLSVFGPLHQARPLVGPPNVVLNQAAFTPGQIRHAHGFDQTSFTSGPRTISGDGRGQTIALVDAFDPNIASDLAVFDATFALPGSPAFQKADQYGGADDPAVDSGWDLQIALDVERAHTVAPKANLILVEAASNCFNDMLTAVDYARHLRTVSVISMSWGGWETEVGASMNLSMLDSFFTTPSGHAGITFVASSGDDEAAEATLWPSASAYALALGGTTLRPTDCHGTYGSESAWTVGGGGTSAFESEPSWQAPYQSSTRRTTPDVSYDGGPQTGFAVYDGVPTADPTGQPVSGWIQIGGTSATSPQWSALLAIADQGRALLGKGPLNQAQVAIYALSPADFQDVTPAAVAEGHVKQGAGAEPVRVRLPAMRAEGQAEESAILRAGQHDWVGWTILALGAGLALAGSRKRADKRGERETGSHPFDRYLKN